MNESCYTESICERKVTGKALFGIMMMVLATIAGIVVFIYYTWWGVPIFASILITAFFLKKYLRVSYETIFVMGEIQIDKIYSGTLRKDGIRVDLAVVETVERISQEEIRQLKSGRSVKIEDYWSHKEGASVYKVVYRTDGTQHCLLFEPSEKMLRLMRRTAPSKVKVSYEILNKTDD